MGDLKPLGSEKLQGMDKINRILEISRFRDNTPKSINETSRTEYSLRLSDGNEYQIVKEKVGYVIKRTISESETDYIEPMKNRKYYSSYSQALKRLNLMAKETNSLMENKEGTSLFSEQKKFVLKTPQKSQPPMDDVENVPVPSSPEPAPSPAPAPMGEPSPQDDMPDAEGPTPEGEDMGDAEAPTPEGEDMGDEMSSDENQSETEQVSFKSIQKLVGKLGQKLRTLESQGEESMSSKDMKYVINSILSALDLSKMDMDDVEEITSKFEDIESEDEESPEMDDMSNDEPESEEGPIQPEEGEMDESWADLGMEIAGKTMMKGMTPGEHTEGMDHYDKIRTIADEMFTESNVEKILSGYFVISENEKKHKEKMNSVKLALKKQENKTIAKEIKRLSENVIQEVSSRKFVNENKNAKFIGKTNKRNLVFEINNKQVKISPEGNLI